MPLGKTVWRRASCTPRDREEVEQQAPRPVLAAAGGRAAARQRPHQAFVESRLKQYLQDNDVQCLVKPGRDEIRAAALPILCRARRRRTGREALDTAQRAVAAMVHHARKERWIKLHITDAYESPGPTFIDDLIRFAGEANWLAREIPLPAHPPPHHPTIYYTMDSRTNEPVPREDSLIRANYVHTLQGRPITTADHIRPWPIADFPDSEMACYTIQFADDGDLQLYFHWIEPLLTAMRFRRTRRLNVTSCARMSDMRFSAFPPC